MKFIAAAFLLLGFLLLAQVVWPVISFKIWEAALADENNINLVSPQEEIYEVKGVSIQTDNNFPAFISTLGRTAPATFEQFDVSIPALKLETEVYTDSNELNLGLVHLPGSALPGEKGNVFISGHSALPTIFQKDQKAFFANLQKLKKGDSIEVSVGGSKFSYKVIGTKVVNPKDLAVIFPPDDQGRYITLMTCVPPGLNTKRLVVLGELL